MEAYWAAKRSLFDRVAHASARWSTRTTSAAARGGELPARTTSASRHDADVRALDVRLEADGAQFTSPSAGEGAERAAVRSRCPARNNVDNVVAAAAARTCSRGGRGDRRGGVGGGAPAGTPRAPGRGQPSTVVTLRHSPDSVRRTLETCSAIGADGRLIVVFGATGRRFAATRPEMAPSAGDRSTS